MSVEVLLTLMGLGSVFISVLFGVRFKKPIDDVVTRELRKLDEALRETVTDVVDDEYVVRQVTRVTSPLLPAATVVEAEVQDHIDRAVASLRSRLEDIEQRFPDKSEIDKIASVNDAIMATRIEALQESVKRLQKQVDDQLTKWDVATIVFAVLGTLGVIVGLVFGVIKFVTGG
ncbi:MAG: hypothetical protein ACRDRX_13875 [Pseudonocardiaceae bacterium]